MLTGFACSRLGDFGKNVAHGGAISGLISPSFQRSIEKYFEDGDREDRVLKETVKLTARQLCGGKEEAFGITHVTAGSKNKHLYFEGVYGSFFTAQQRSNQDRGRRLESHNLDNHVGQLSYLMGIAQLCKDIERSS